MNVYINIGKPNIDNGGGGGSRKMALKSVFIQSMAKALSLDTKTMLYRLTYGTFKLLLTYAIILSIERKNQFYTAIGLSIYVKNVFYLLYYFKTTFK